MHITVNLPTDKWVLFFVRRMKDFVMKEMSDRFMNEFFIFCRKDIRFCYERNKG